MKLLKLIEDIKILRTNIKNDIEIENMTKNSKKCGKNFLFFCHKGTVTDGNNFIVEAKQNGAVVFVTEKDPDGADGINRQINSCGHILYILVENSRKTEAELWMKWFSYPSRNMKIIGITGTNGKTSTSYMIKEILSQAGYKTALLGTIKYIIGDTEKNADLTTSDPDELAELFYEISKNKCEYVVMEVSSHSLALDKVSALHFDIGIFTNLTQDHLDFHGTMENYKIAKSKLFEMCDIGLFNADDKATVDLINKVGCSKSFQSCLYGIDNAASDFKAENINYKSVDGSEYDLRFKGNDIHIKSAIPGQPYIYNTMAAAAVGKILEIDDNIIIKSLENLKVNGRIEKIDTGGIKTGKDKDEIKFSVFIDYAHTPDALLNVLKSIQQFRTGRIITLFGCGGDRDKKKRPIMGKIAAENSDYCILTSDNSRSENPSDIINDIEKGLENVKTPYIKITDRKEAIEYALDFAAENDIILLAGKGHETYRKDKFGISEFNEKKIVLSYLEYKSNN